ncbi:sugar phosphate nucleotidyltransferase [Desulfoluna spongiiphila]|uniref:Phosphotransferase enzyme family protein n=1 Tax=Desulfoluna spongiiphila TaxID=419481 RepID=A0A1G5AKG7_9BACT|nr:sugar phosphate nucleotidyltransferase [Desulfoluna spongiiphila]SCX78379.1 Phosphotransferase enzyme family protein [Desulfoluna spongiiphila]
MQAMILAAGLGTRLLPHTEVRPKPLFTIGGITLLERHINALADAGFDAIIINTCHLAGEIRRCIGKKSWPIPVHLRQEETLLESAGAVANVADLLDGSPLLVVNGDTLTDIDPKAVYEAHLTQENTATLALMDHAAFNNVSVDDTGRIHVFRDPTPEGMQRLAFTGMQVLSPEAVAAIPRKKYGMVDLYRDLIDKDERVQGITMENCLWFDCGTEERYLEASRALMVPEAFRQAFGTAPKHHTTEPLKGDGSDRRWSRLKSPKGDLIACEHGINAGFTTGEAEAMIRIGTHLQAKGIPVSPILEGDAVSGLVCVKDAGNIHLAELAKTLPEPEVEALYQRIIDALIRFSQEGIHAFNTQWCWQTPAYDKDMILTMECRYFMDAFINGYLGMNEPAEPYQAAFDLIADKALKGALPGLMHRDFQSRNIMVHQDASEAYTPTIIDFQGARLGPFQYDLASLLIDPYAGLSAPLQGRLIAYATQALADHGIPVKKEFHTSYTFYAMARNLQMLGAFGKLSALGKPGFKEHIPRALATLEKRLKGLNNPKLSQLGKLVERAKKNLPPTSGG